MTVIELVRHGSAGKRDQWTGGPDRKRPLDAKGVRQAEALGKALAEGPPIRTIVSSSYTRCVMTVAPLAERLGLEVATDPALEELETVPLTEGGTPWVTAAWLGGRALALIDRCVAAGGATRTVLCSHGDVIPAVVATLAGRDALSLSDVTCAKGGRFVLQFSDGRCVEARRMQPPVT